MRKRGDDYIVQPVMKALQVLEHVARQSHEVTLTEIVSELKLPKTTVFRYLQTLSAASLSPSRSKDGIATASGCGFRALAKADKNLQRLRVLAQPEMLGLMETFNETVNLGVLSDRHIVYVDMVEPNRTARIHARVGDRHPVHSTSLGKAIAAFFRNRTKTCFAEDRSRPMTIRTVTTAKALRRQMDDVRPARVCDRDGRERRWPQMCIGVPFLDRAGYPIAAMSLSAPERRMKPEVDVHAVEALKIRRPEDLDQARARYEDGSVSTSERAAFVSAEYVHAGCSVRRNCLSLTRIFADY